MLSYPQKRYLSYFLWLPILASLFAVVATTYSSVPSGTLIAVVLGAGLLVGIVLENLNHSTVRKLEKNRADEFRQTDRHIHIEHILNVTTRVIEIAILQIESSRKQTEDSITEMSQRFGNIAHYLNSRSVEENAPANIKLIRKTKTVADDISDITDDVDGILHLLQFQDRTSQILSHVRDALTMLVSKIVVRGDDAENKDIRDIDEVLKKLEDSYSTDEERQLHNNGVSTRKEGTEGSALEFF